MITARQQPRPVVVLDIVGLTPRQLSHMPRLAAYADACATARLDPVFPAVTCSVQSSMLTGLPPREHGVVGNGWYFRDLGEVLFWRQHNGLVAGDKVWDIARRARPSFRTANLCWWYAMGAASDVVVTPRPVYHADGRKSPDCYTVPGSLRGELTAQLGRFPLFSYWGPGAGIKSSAWIAAAAGRVLSRYRPDLTLVYLPHLDYDLQRFGPSGPQAARAACEIDEVAGRLLDTCRRADATVVVVSEYGITPVSRPVHLNRILRRDGLLRVYEQAGMEYLDPVTSRAFAVADHQAAHVYVADPSDVPGVAATLADVPGVAEVLDGPGKAAHQVDHERSGELVCVAEPDAWFTHYYWLDDRQAPDFARTVEIHRKPGYDPAELFMDPGDPLVRFRAAAALARKALGLRYTLNVVPLDASCVQGSHGRLPDSGDQADAPLLLCPVPGALPSERIAATAVKDVLLALAEVTPPAPRPSSPDAREATY
ncbi:MAG TPA: nucleotide pyrophosphatase/phosphodiesterase family protein [Streptosporangiaceae bacterium]|nr:nucleotide pyrophosphatase/phosphodiesterase family protein [Streptosporangiaceae bacterium]